MGLCIMIKTITGFLQRLLFINRKVIIAELKGEDSTINSYNLAVNERIGLAATTFCEIFNRDTKRINLSQKAKVDMIIMIFKEISQQIGVDINITKNERKK